MVIKVICKSPESPIAVIPTVSLQQLPYPCIFAKTPLSTQRESQTCRKNCAELSTQLFVPMATIPF